LIQAPAKAYDIQQHEVTWHEIEPWSKLNGPVIARPRSDGEEHPARGIHWKVAQSYCKSLGGDLPTEEQWEYAARGDEERPYPWGSQLILMSSTHVYRSGKVLSVVMSNPQDKTPGDAAHSIYDLLGNAREWTLDLYRSNATGVPAAWVTSRGRTFRALRGLPPNSEPPQQVPSVGAAFRAVLCATSAAGSCATNESEEREYQTALEFVGFRCVKVGR
jgi:formylglycine-generating enzyme required for sulfatase activity